MSKNINLLPRKSKEVLKREKKIKRLTRYSFISLFAVFFIFVFVLFLNKISPYRRDENKKNDLLKIFSSLSEKTSRYIFINKRLNDISDINNKRSYMDKVLDKVLDQIPERVSLSSVTINKDTVGISVSSLSLSKINIFLDNLTNLVNEDKTFNRVILHSINLNEKEKIYSLSLSLYFP